jgi:AcrR family transcriptional regulator
MEDIAEAAGISRPSLYSYFPSKRSIMIALGVKSVEHGDRVLATLCSIPPKNWSRDHIASWVDQKFEYNDSFGAIVVAWWEVAHGDPSLEEAGLLSARTSWRKHGEALRRLSSSSPKDDERMGKVVVCLVDRLWWWSRQFPGSDKEFREDATTAIVVLLKHPPRFAYAGGGKPSGVA